SDYKVLIPDSYFTGTNAGDFIYLYSAFSDANSGFEEWSVGPASPPGPTPHATLSIDKETVCVDENGDQHIIGGSIVKAGSFIQFTYAVTATGGAISNVVIVDDNGTPDDGIDGNGDETADDLSTSDGSIIAVLKADNVHNAGDSNNNGVFD